MQVSSAEEKVSLAIAGDQGNLPALRQQYDTSLAVATNHVTSLTPSMLTGVMKDGVPMSVLRKENELNLIASIIVLIGMTAKTLNVPRMNGEQTIDAARTLIKTFWYLKPEEVAYAFDRGRAGHYGKDYNRLDLKVLSDWLTAYDTGERQSICERMRSEQTEAEQQDGRHTVEQVRESYQRFADGMPTVQQKLDEQRKAREQKERERDEEFRQFRQQYLSGQREREEYLRQSRQEYLAGQIQQSPEPAGGSDS